MKQGGSIVTGAIYALIALLVVVVTIDFLSNQPVGIPKTAFKAEPVDSNKEKFEVTSVPKPTAIPEGERVDRETDRFLRESQNLAPSNTASSEPNVVQSQLKPTGWLRRSSFVCTSQPLYQRLRDAIAVTDVYGVEALLDQGCYEIGKRAKADILIWDLDAGRAKIRAYEGNNVVTLWTHVSNVDRN